MNLIFFSFSLVVNPNWSANTSYFYNSELTSESKQFFRKMSLRKHYYETLTLNVSVTGNYTFTSISNMDMYAYLFYNEFDPLMHCQNLIRDNDDITDDNSNFQIQSILQSSMTYILVITTYYSNETGTFSVVIQGPEKVHIVRVNTIELSSSMFLEHSNEKM